MYPVPVGAQTWGCCMTCAELMRSVQKGAPRPAQPFGRDTFTLAPAQQGMAGWASYRYACHEVGYTLFTARDRAERDLLHDTWSRWSAYLLRERRNIGTVKDNPKGLFFLVPFLLHLTEQYGPLPSSHPSHDDWLLAQCKETPDLLRSKLRGRFGPIPEPRDLLNGHRVDTGHAAAPVA